MVRDMLAKELRRLKNELFQSRVIKIEKLKGEISEREQYLQELEG